jgi:hypothetical protein
MKRIYIAGPMTGLPDLNYSAFHSEAARLRGLGHHVENPAENLAPACGTWKAYMLMAINQLFTCDTIFLLPGYTMSKGAMLEFQIAMSLDLHFMCADSEDQS